MNEIAKSLPETNFYRREEIFRGDSMAEQDKGKVNYAEAKGGGLGGRMKDGKGNFFLLYLVKGSF